MTRAERRRLEREQKKHAGKKPIAGSNITNKELDILIDRAGEKMFRELKQDVYDQAVNDAMLLLLTIPLEVLMKYYWTKSYTQRLPKFTNYILEYYQKWQSGELDMDELKEHLWEYGGVRLERTGVE